MKLSARLGSASQRGSGAEQVDYKFKDAIITPAHSRSRGSRAKLEKAMRSAGEGERFYRKLQQREEPGCESGSKPPRPRGRFPSPPGTARRRDARLLWLDQRTSQIEQLRQAMEQEAAWQQRGRLGSSSQISSSPCKIACWFLVSGGKCGLPAFRRR